MTNPQITTDLSEILTQINQKLGKIDERLNHLEVGQARLEEKVNGIDKRLEEKTDALGKQLDNQEFINRGVVIGLLLAILGGLAKLFGFIGNP